MVHRAPVVKHYKVSVSDNVNILCLWYVICNNLVAKNCKHIKFDTVFTISLHILLQTVCGLSRGFLFTDFTEVYVRFANHDVCFTCQLL